MRDAKRLAEIRKLPCVKCGKPAPSEACHANWAEYGKSLGKKASDEFTISLCRTCHYEFDTYSSMKRDESKEWFAKMRDLKEEKNPSYEQLRKFISDKMSTTEASVKQFTEYLNDIHTWALTNDGFYLEKPEDLMYVLE